MAATGSVIRLADRRPNPAHVRFERSELLLLLNLYARHVATGEWRDYAIDSGAGQALFAAFRSAFDRPAVTIAKRPGDKVVVAGPDGIIARARSVAEAVARLEGTPRRAE